MASTGGAILLPLDSLGSNKAYGRSSRDNSTIGPLTSYGLQERPWSANLTVPMPTVFTAVSLGGSMRGRGAVPMPKAAGHFGWTAGLKVPRARLVAAGEGMNLLRAELLVPMSTMAGSFISGAVMTGHLAVPMPTLLTRTGWRVALVSPRMLASATGSRVGGGSAHLRVPFPRVFATGVVTSYPSRGSLVVPMPRSGPYGSAHLTVPMPFINATGGLATLAIDGWCMNLRNKAVTHWTHMPFVEVVAIGSRVLAIGEDGNLYELGGDLDIDQPIQWAFETGLEDFGKAGMKRMPYVYLNGIITGEVRITVIDDRAREFAYYYDTKDRPPIHIPHRRKLGNGIQTRNIALRIDSETGAYCEFDSIEPEITVSQRSV